MYIVALRAEDTSVPFEYLVSDLCSGLTLILRPGMGGVGTTNCYP